VSHQGQHTLLPKWACAECTFDEDVTVIQKAGYQSS